MDELSSGKYRLVERLATGGMAEVFLARVKGPASFERRLVIKRALPQFAAVEEFVELFEREARFSALLEHPNVAQVYDFGRDSAGRPWLAMEYVDGASLRQLLRASTAKQEATDARLVARVFAQAAEGLAAAHDVLDPETREPMKLVHRDVSPENILVSRVGAVKVSDFGIARAMVKASTTEPGTLRGKLRYLAPEQILGQEATHAVDVWALGVSLFEVLAGQRPFPEDSEGQLVSAIANGARAALRALRPDLPSALVTIVDQCLEVDVARRMPDCHELAMALDRFVSSSGAPVGTAAIGAWVERLAPPRAEPSQWVGEVLTPGGSIETVLGSPEVAAPRPPPPAPAPLELAAPARQPEAPQRPASPPPVDVGAAPRPRRGALLAVAVAGLLLIAAALAWSPARRLAASPTRVMVVSTPPGATVRVNGAEVGTTPLGGDLPGEAPSVVDVEAAGYAPWRATVLPGEVSNLDAQLTRKR